MRLLSAVSVAAVLLRLALLVILVRAYRQGGKKGVLPLLLAVVVWPAIHDVSGYWLTLLVRVSPQERLPRLTRVLFALGWSPGTFLLVVERLMSLVGLALLVVGVACALRPDPARALAGDAGGLPMSPGSSAAWPLTRGAGG